MGKINGGGYNSFYDIPKEVTNVDQLAKFLKASGPVFNILKSLFGLNKNRHTGTSSKRDSEKIIHYGIENYLWQPDVEEETHSDVIYKLITELKEEDRVMLLGRLEQLKRVLKVAPKDDNITLYDNVVEKPKMRVHNEGDMPDPSDYGIDRETMSEAKPMVCNH